MGQAVFPCWTTQHDPVRSMGNLAAIRAVSAIASGSITGTPMLSTSARRSPNAPVSVIPGQIVCTEMPSGARLDAMARIKPTTACLPSE
jgi:hypothetical protein